MSKKNIPPVKTNPTASGSDSKRREWQKRQPILQEGPAFDAEVLPHLPQLIQDVVMISPIEKLNDIVMLSTIAVLSSVLPKIEGRFGGKVYKANLYLMILAPPASNKSIVDDVVKIVEPIDDAIYAGKYDTELNKTDRRGLMLSGNTSKAGITEELAKMPESSLLYDSEIDSTAQVMSQEWGGHSDVLRKAAEHETINEKRKGKEVVRIKKPAVTAILVGTPSQISGMIDEISSGLASRFSYFSFRCTEYIREEDRLKIDTQLIIQQAQTKVFELFEFHLSHPATFTLTDPQLTEIDKVFEQYVKDYQDHDGMRAVTLRMKTVLFRLCMILAAIEKWERSDTSTQFTCSQQAFDAAFLMVQNLMSHSNVVMEFVDSGIQIKLPLDESKVFDSLEECFTAKDLYDAFEKITGNRIDRTARDWCARWERAGLIEKKSHGNYCKK